MSVLLMFTKRARRTRRNSHHIQSPTSELSRTQTHVRYTLQVFQQSSSSILDGSQVPRQLNDTRGIQIITRFDSPSDPLGRPYQSKPPPDEDRNDECGDVEEDDLFRRKQGFGSEGREGEAEHGGEDLRVGQSVSHISEEERTLTSSNPTRRLRRDASLVVARRFSDALA